MLVMVVATVAVHLGLPQEAAKVMSKVCQCPKCMSFWSTLIVLIFLGEDIITSAALSLFIAYLSNWFGILLHLLNKLYDKLWERVNRKS